ncbi:glycosyltransferase [Planomicrobium sp. YIM 101495]|uniref:glycosyltransferase n=1 Tax=Planomicrobium sp. YIM 101495 TaxID=2665160 RepID=UPI0012B85565|nr:glycosyltransferase [Planomicrobium sp. YIM 101495]MTD30766.1 glycosyltransferase [Planomicrobium sp. YIM 101495]
MKKVLIVSYLFAPENAIGAVRPTKLAKYFLKEGHKIDVITTSNKKNIDKRSLDDLKGIKIYELKHSSIIEKYLNRGRGITEKNNGVPTISKEGKVYFGGREAKKKIKHLIFLLLNIFVALDFLLKFRKHVKKNDEKYDVVLTTYGPLSSVLCGLYYKKRLKSTKWICDFRDPMVVDTFPKLINFIHKFIQSKACKEADKIISVSEGYLKRIIKEKHRFKAEVITNGYDKDDYPANFVNPRKFSFAYTGYLYNGKRDLSSLFLVIRELIDEGKLDKNEVEFNYAGNDFNALKLQALKHNLQDILIDHGYVTREESINLQQISRFLVLSTWNSKKEIGVFPGKFLEYMLLKKPIIAIINGDLANSEVAKVIEKSKIGVFFEEANYDKDQIQLKDYISLEYDLYKNKKPTSFQPNREFVRKYDYRNITREFERIL